MRYHTQIRPKFGQIFKNIKKCQKRKQNICVQATSENGKISAMRPHKGQVPNPG